MISCLTEADRTQKKQIFKDINESETLTLVFYFKINVIFM